MNDERQLCTVYVESLFCGIDVRKVQEALPAQPLTAVPLASRFVRGLINLRGQIVAAIDLRQCLQLPPNPNASIPLILRDGDEMMALLVDRVGEVLAVDEASFEPPSLPLGEAASGLVMGVYKLPGQIIHVLEIEAIARLVANPRDAK